MENFDDVIREHAIVNRIKYGHASEKAVYGQVLAGVPEARKNAKQVSERVAVVVAEVNALDEASLRGMKQRGIRDVRSAWRALS